MASSGEQDILREYLISLGFKVNTAAEQKFGKNLTKMDKSAMALGKSLVGVATAAAVMATEFSFRMEKLFYSSKLAESSAANLNAIDMVGKQNGIQNMTANVQNLARSLRANPGLQGLLHSLGVKVEGRDMSDVAIDLAKALSKMPTYIAQGFGAKFGWSADDIFLMSQAGDKLREQLALQKQMAKDMGVDVDKAAEVGLEYAKQWRELIQYAKLFQMAVMVEVVPAMRELAGVTKSVLQDWVKIVQTPREKFVEDMKLGLGLPGSEGERGKVELSEDAQRRLSGGKGFSPAEQKIYDELPYHAPKGNKGAGRALEDYLYKRARKQAVERGDIPFDAKEGDRKPGTMTREEAGLPQEGEKKEELYRAPSHTKGGPLKWWEDWQRWRENRDRAKRGEAPLPEPSASGQDATTASPTAPPAATPPPAAEKPSTPASGDVREKQSFLSALEGKYALPRGMMDRVWLRESGRGQNKLGPMTKSGRAKGDFQFTDDTAKEQGLDENSVNDFFKSGAASAKFYADLIRKYHNDARLAAAAYNWGQGNVDKLMDRTKAQHKDWDQGQVDTHVLGRVPEETRKYINAVVGNSDSGQSGGTTVHIKADTRIEVQGNIDPNATADAVAEQQKQVWADVIRNQSQKVR